MPNAPATQELLEQERLYVKSVYRQAFSVLLSCLRAASRGRDLAKDVTLDFTEEEDLGLADWEHVLLKVN